MSRTITDGQHVRTGNKPHAVVSHEQYLKAKRWGIKRGYSGAPGDGYMTRTESASAMDGPSSTAFKVFASSEIHHEKTNYTSRDAR